MRTEKKTWPRGLVLTHYGYGTPSKFQIVQIGMNLFTLVYMKEGNRWSDSPYRASSSESSSGLYIDRFKKHFSDFFDEANHDVVRIGRRPA